MIFNEKGLNDSFFDFFTKRKGTLQEVGKVLSFEEARKQLDAFNASVIIGGQALDDYFEENNKGTKFLQEYVTTVDTQNQSYQGLVKYSQEATAAQIAHNKAIEQASIKARAASFAIKTMALAGNMLVTALLSFVVSGIIKAIDNHIHAAENAVKAMQDAQDEIKKLNQDFQEHKELVQETALRYTELSKGVDKASNKNLSLSDDEYKEYLEITNELAEAFPTLQKTIDDNGNAILTLGENGKSAAAELRELLEVEEDLKNFEISHFIILFIIT